MDGIKEEVLRECFGQQPVHIKIMKAGPTYATDLLNKVRTMLLDARIYLKDKNNRRSNKVLKVLFANKCVLSAASGTFRRLYLGQYQDDIASFWLKELGCATISDFESVIDFIYSGKITMDLDNIEQILHIAGHLEIVALLRLCEDYLKSILNNGTCVKVFLVLCENDNVVKGSLTLTEMKRNLQRYIALEFGRSVRDKAIYKYSLKDILHLLENGCLTELDQGKLGLHFACTLIYTGKQTDSQLLLKVARLAVSRMLQNIGTLTEPMKQKLIEQVEAVNDLVLNRFEVPELLGEFIIKLSGTDRRVRNRKTRYHERSKYTALIATKQGDGVEDTTVKAPTVQKNIEKKSIMASKCAVNNNELQIKTSENKSISLTDYTVGNTKFRNMCKRKGPDDCITTSVPNLKEYPLFKCSKIESQYTPKPEFNENPAHILENESMDEETVDMEHDIGENVVVKVERDNSGRFMELDMAEIIQTTHASECTEDSIKCEADQEANIDTVCGQIFENIDVKVEPYDLSTLPPYIVSNEEDIHISPGISDISMTESCAESVLESVIKVERVNDDNTIEQFVLQTGMNQQNIVDTDVSYLLNTEMNSNLQTANTFASASPSVPCVLVGSFKAKDGPDRAAIDCATITNSLNLDQPLRTSCKSSSQMRKRSNTNRGTGNRKKRIAKLSCRTVDASSGSMETSSGALYNLIIPEQVASRETKPGTTVNMFGNDVPSTPEQETMTQSCLHKCSLNLETTTGAVSQARRQKTKVKLGNRKQGKFNEPKQTEIPIADITEVDKCVSPNKKDSNDDEVPVHREVRSYKTRNLHQPKFHSCKGYNNVTVVTNKLPMSVTHVSNIKSTMASHKNACKGEAKPITAASSGGTLPVIIDSQCHLTVRGVQNDKLEMIGTLPETELQATGVIGMTPASKSNIQDTTVLNIKPAKCQMKKGCVTDSVVMVSIIPKHRIKTLRKCIEQKIKAQKLELNAGSTQSVIGNVSLDSVVMSNQSVVGNFSFDSVVGSNQSVVGNVSLDSVVRSNQSVIGNAALDSVIGSNQSDVGNVSLDSVVRSNQSGVGNISVDSAF